ncbi:right-handed parallel beta-helix repeat-containing protein [Haloterrigena salifodinae]|uniref:Right-handed parallel beta-helix repeat-containing protein n=1 Tax=Haloterrigena salifodinae TaxID=2675099 RepID=A0A8T8E5K3_9EURY|nr:right-handed parallel beta-helix repeat-containing protein [Haloterrigena salifodinae]QRV16893.1 right-handed parallel beta-helix repeat-containing protein [Haloterrigena salifodinae]
MSNGNHQETVDRRSYLAGSAVALSALSMGSGVAAAGDGKKSGNHDPADGDRTESTITECTTITESGTYVLADDLETAPETACITVRASDVLIDGRGHSISGPNGQGVEGVGVSVQPPGEESISNVTVTDLTLERLRTGIVFDDVTDGVIKAVTSEMTTIAGTNFVLVDADRNTLVDNDLERGGSGIYLINANENVVVGNSTASTFFPGLDLLESDGNTLIGNTVTSVDGVGILLQRSDGNHLLQNTATLNAIGISLVGSNDNRLDLNAANENVAVGGGSGFHLSGSDRNSGRGNTAEENPFGPISISGAGNAIEVNGTVYTGDPATGTVEAEADDDTVEKDLTEAKNEVLAFTDTNRP